MQRPGAVQDTAVRLLRAGLRVLSARQLVPFHASARVCVRWSPTAMQRAALAQDTEVRLLDARAGVLSSRQLVPFHASARVRVPWSPTAMQRAVLVQDTDVRLLDAVPAGLAVVSIRQRVPFHASARVRLAADADAAELPTAMHQEAWGQDTLAKSLLYAAAETAVAASPAGAPAARAAAGISAAAQAKAAAPISRLEDMAGKRMPARARVFCLTISDHSLHRAAAAGSGQQTSNR
jgi:hypothetical protein